MTEQTKTRIPAPLYAAAGAGDLAIEQLRKLPAVVNELSDRAAASLYTVNTKAATLRDKAGTADFDRIRNTAADSALTIAQVASERAVALYTALVARGERVVGTGVIEAAEVVNADMVTTEPQAPGEIAVDAEPTAQPAAEATAQPAAAPTPKPRKRAARSTPPAAE